jgi:TonB-linked SusC/RagA family outer membrane protein
MKQIFKNISFALLLVSSMTLPAQEKTIVRGSVVDVETKEVIIGATVTEYDQDARIINGTITDVNGNFTLRINNPQALLRFSYIGYQPKEMKLNGQVFLEIKLVAESYEFDEVVVRAETNTDPLSNVARRDMASSRVKIDMEESMHMGVVSAEEALQGKVTGLDIMSFSGDPGGGSSIVIRGLGSLGNAKPLIVVDGIPQSVAVGSDFDFNSADQEDIGDLVSIAPQDIKSIDVLKDAASAAAWGSKGADGVLLIETFRGSKGKTKFNYQAKTTLNIQPSPIPMLNGNEYIMLQLEEWHNSMGIYDVPQEISYDPNYIDFYNYSANTDWVGEVSRNGFINEHYFKLSGGGEKTNYFASVNTHNNIGTTLNTSLKRVTTRINLDYNVSKKIRLSVNFSYSNSIKEDNYTFRVQDSQTGNWTWTNIREMAYQKAPNMSVWEYNSNGELTGEYFNPVESYQGSGLQYFNPVAVGNLSMNDVNEGRVMDNFILTYRITPWLNFIQTVSLQYIDKKNNQFLPSDAVGSDWLDYLVNYQMETNSSNTEVITRSQLNFIPRLRDDHQLTGMTMFETDRIDYEWSRLNAKNGPSTTISDPASNSPIHSIASGRSETHILGTLLNINYKYKDRYITQLNLRADASSRFGAANRWGVFPSVSVAWRFIEEPWMERFDFITDSKLRYSYGQAGKQPNSPYERHAIYNTANPGQYIENPIIVQQQVQLDSLKWQTLTQNNLGLDLSLYGRLFITMEIYSKITSDLLWSNYEIPTSSGFEILNKYNGGELLNKGWEINLNGLVLNSDKTSLNLNFNISHNVNSFLKFPENFNNEVDLNIGNGQYPRRASLGEPIGSFYGFRYLGVWPSDDAVVAYNENGEILKDINGNPVPLTYKGIYKFQGGDAIYEDVNHDGQIDLLDVVYLGDSNPTFIGGFGGNLKWKDFRVSTQWHYRLGFMVVNEVAINTEGMINKNNQSEAVLHRWRTAGQDAEDMLPRAYLDHPANNLGSDRYVEPGDFLRLVNMTFAYRLPRKVSNKLRIQSLDLALTMRRIFTLTRYSGQDPEISPNIDDPFWFGIDKASTPPPKAYTISLSVGF